MKVKVIKSTFSKIEKQGFSAILKKKIGKYIDNVIMAETSFYFTHNKQSFY